MLVSDLTQKINHAIDWLTWLPSWSIALMLGLLVFRYLVNMFARAVV